MGHLSRDCPRRVPRNNPRASTSKVEEENNSPPDPVKTKFSADDIIEIMRNVDDKDKDEVIQKVFMTQDF